MGDDFDDLTQPSGGRRAGDLTAEIATALGEAPGRLTVEPEDDEMAWLSRDGVRLSRFNLRATGSADPGRRTAFADALAELVRRFDALRPTIDGLEIGRAYRVDYKHERLRRTFRVKGVLVEVSAWRPAEGPTGGGWMLTLESRPRFGGPSTFHVDTAVMTRIVTA